ncbi:hypothetical protein ElyMa_006893200, partial [Elysia marginata]
QFRQATIAKVSTQTTPRRLREHNLRARLASGKVSVDLSSSYRPAGLAQASLVLETTGV